jgi:AcrR family transcriptional regulator
MIRNQKTLQAAPSPKASEGRRQLKSAERRRRVLAAANRCFGKHGFRKTSVDLIASEAGVSKGLVFAFFGDKDALYDAVIQQTLTTWTGFAEHQAARYHANPDLELASMFRGSFEFVSHSPMLRMLMARRDREIQEKGRSLPRIERDWRSRIAEVMQRGVEQGVFRSDMDCPLTSFVVHDIQHFYLDQMLGVELGEYDPAKMELALQLILQAIKAPTERPGVQPRAKRASAAPAPAKRKRPLRSAR